MPLHHENREVAVHLRTDMGRSSSTGRDLLALLALAVSAAVASGPACRGGGGTDGDADGDAEGDADGDADGDGGGDADADDDGGGGGCVALLGGECNPVEQCGCDPSMACDLTEGAEGVSEVCADAAGYGTGVHEEACPCAPGYACFDPGVCLRYCDDSRDCPELSFCTIYFTMPGGGDPSPYAACSPVYPEVEATYGTCVGSPGDCPAGGTLGERQVDSTVTEDWACTVDLGETDMITVDFHIDAGAFGIFAAGLHARRQSSRFTTSQGCPTFEVVEEGVTFAPSDCVSGLPTSGTCVVTLKYIDPGWVSGTFNCLEIPAESGGDVLSTMNGAESGAGNFDLRRCTVTGE